MYIEVKSNAPQNESEARCKTYKAFIKNIREHFRDPEFCKDFSDVTVKA